MLYHAVAMAFALSVQTPRPSFAFLSPPAAAAAPFLLLLLLLVEQVVPCNKYRLHTLRFGAIRVARVRSCVAHSLAARIALTYLKVRTEEVQGSQLYCHDV